MLNLKEFIGAPSLYLYHRYDLFALAPSCAVACIGAVLADALLPSSISLFISAPCLIFIAYMYIGFAYFRAKNIEISRTLVQQAKEGVWHSGSNNIPARWRRRGSIPFIVDYLVKVQRLHDETARTSQDLLLTSQKASQSSAELSEHAEEIASMLEETAAGLEEFTASIERNAQNCREVNALALKAAEAAYDGADQVSAINNAVDLTGKKSEKVLEVITLIESFAAQTNMLSLNASIEAARAGQHGKGFTQVADEVRELSNRSSEAARVIRDRIIDASKQVRAGMKTANESSSILEDVLTQVTQAQQLIEDVANASTEQSAGVSQIKNAVELMASLTQQNSHAVDEVAKIAVGLEKEAISLDESLESQKTIRLGNREDCINMVRRAAQLVQTKGAIAAAKTFSERNGSFHMNDLFIVLSDIYGQVLGHGGEPTLIGTNCYEKTDTNGFAFVKATCEMVRGPGSGWLDFRIRNPATGEDAIKSLYVERVPNTEYWVGCGTFSRVRSRSEEKAALTALPENS